MTREEAITFVHERRAGGETIVFTNGVFDLLHPGHLRYLKLARALGDVLIVGVNSDRSVRANKGPSRPVTPEAERAEVLSALACVEAAVIFDEETPWQLIAALQPDVLVKGADWAESFGSPSRPDTRPPQSSSASAAPADSRCRAFPASTLQLRADQFATLAVSACPQRRR